MSEVDELKQQVTQLQDEVNDLTFAVSQLAKHVADIEDKYHRLTDQLVIKAIQKINQENQG